MDSLSRAERLEGAPKSKYRFGAAYRALLILSVPMLISSGRVTTSRTVQNHTSTCIEGTTYNVQTAVVNPVEIKGNVTKFRAGPGLFWVGDVRKDRIRSELQSRFTQLPGRRSTVQYDVKVSAEPSLKSSSLVLGQFHATADQGDFQGYPVVELNLAQSGLAIYTASVADAQRTSSYPRTLRASKIPFELGKWHSISIDLVDSFESRGSLCVKVDGRTQYCESNISVGMNDAVGPYWKFGLYYMPAAAKMNISASYKNVILNGSRSC